MEKQITKENFCRKQVTLYWSFFDTLQDISDDAERGRAYDAILRYGFLNEMPQLEKLTPLQRSCFKMAKPVMDTARDKAWAGKQHGKSIQTEAEQNGNKGEREKEIEKEIEIEIESLPLPRRGKAMGVCVLKNFGIYIPKRWARRRRSANFAGSRSPIGC